MILITQTQMMTGSAREINPNALVLVELWITMGFATKYQLHTVNRKLFIKLAFHCFSLQINGHAVQMQIL